MAEVGLQLHPDKTKIVYCKDRKRCQRYDGPASFKMGEEVRSWRIHHRTATELEDIAAWINLSSEGG
jgi:RNA-directed DNA polymerase